MSEDKDTAIRARIIAGSTYKEFQSSHPELNRDPVLRDKFLEYYIDKTEVRVDGIPSVTLRSLEINLKAFMQGPWIQ